MTTFTPITAALPAKLDLTVRGRSPIRLSEETVRIVLDMDLPRATAQVRAPDERPAASILILTHNNLVLNRLCLHALLAHTTADEGYELILIDNGSTDGTVAYLRELAAVNPHVRLILNDANRSFAAANNQGLAVARGEMLVLLNNDTIVPPGWMQRLRTHLADAAVGAVCATTNRIGNEAEIEGQYRTLCELCDFAAAREQAYRDRSFDIPMAPMFCYAMRRDTYERIGTLDEQFVVGMFEDDDYAMRVRAAGLRVLCAEDVFVHHFGGASLGNLMNGGEYRRVFQANRDRFERKWGVEWRPHSKRGAAESPDSRRLRQAVRAALPREGATVAVVSKGDPRLIDLGVNVRACHFLRGSEGGYAGHYPANCGEATAHLEALRADGVQYLLLPETAWWWLEHYPAFARHLYTRYACQHDPALGFYLFDLAGGEP